jgi:hypothetical protein
VVTGLAGLAVGIDVSGLVGLAAAATLFRFVPRRPAVISAERSAAE